MKSAADCACCITFLASPTSRTRTAARCSPIRDGGATSGLSPDAMIGKTDDELFPAQLAQRITIDDQRILASEEYKEREDVYAGCSWSTLKFLLRRAGPGTAARRIGVGHHAAQAGRSPLRGANRQLRMLSDCNQRPRSVQVRIAEAGTCTIGGQETLSTPACHAPAGCHRSGRSADEQPVRGAESG